MGDGGTMVTVVNGGVALCGDLLPSCGGPCGALWRSGGTWNRHRGMKSRCRLRAVFDTCLGLCGMIPW